jgi:hypothetical protein
MKAFRRSAKASLLKSLLRGSGEAAIGETVFRCIYMVKYVLKNPLLKNHWARKAF